MKKNISPAAIAAAIVVVLAGIGFVGLKTAFAPAPGPSPDEIPKRPSPEEMRKLRESEQKGSNAPPAAALPTGGPGDMRGR